MSRMMVCIDCGHMGLDGPKECVAPDTGEFAGENEFATQMVLKMGFVYTGCPKCESPNIFFQPVTASAEATQEEAEVYVDDMVDENEEDEILVEEQKVQAEAPKPVRQQKKKTRSRRRIDKDGKIVTEHIKDTTRPVDDGSDYEFKKGPPQKRKMYHRECKNPNCNRDFETKHSLQGYCDKCLKRCTGQ